MYSILKTSHSHLAWLILAAIVISIVLVIMHKTSKKPFSQATLRLALLGLIAAHTQLLLGLALYFVSPMGFSNLSGASMKDGLMRLLSVEHPFTNILAIVLITIGYSRAKRSTDSTKSYNSIIYLYSIGLLLILSRIPWAQWLA